MEQNLESMAIECGKAVIFSSFKIASQAQMYVMQDYHEEDEHAKILKQDVIYDNMYLGFYCLTSYITNL